MTTAAACVPAFLTTPSSFWAFSIRFFILLSESFNISISLIEDTASSKEFTPNGINFAT